MFLTATFCNNVPIFMLVYYSVSANHSFPILNIPKLKFPWKLPGNLPPQIKNIQFYDKAEILTPNQYMPVYKVFCTPIVQAKSLM